MGLGLEIDFLFFHTEAFVPRLAPICPSSSIPQPYFATINRSIPRPSIDPICPLKFHSTVVRHRLVVLLQFNLSPTNNLILKGSVLGNVLVTRTDVVLFIYSLKLRRFVHEALFSHFLYSLCCFHALQVKAIAVKLVLEVEMVSLRNSIF